MQVSTALLCDAASVREGLLFVLGGGITRLYRAQLPAAMGLTLALTIDLHRMEVGRLHEIAVDVIDSDGKGIFEAKGAFQVYEMPPGVDLHERLILPMIIPLANVMLPAHGSYSVEISINGQHHRSLHFKVIPPPAESLAGTAPPAS